MSETDWLTLERFDCAPLAGRWGVVRMMAALSEKPQIPGTPRLVVTRPELVTTHGAFVNATDRRGSQLLWLASFAIPLEVAEHPQALFELVAPGLPAIALPAPGTLILPLSARAELRLARRLPHLRLGRRATAMATALALSTTSLPVADSPPRRRLRQCTSPTATPPPVPLRRSRRRPRLIRSSSRTSRFRTSPSSSWPRLRPTRTRIRRRRRAVTPHRRQSCLGQ